MGPATQLAPLVRIDAGHCGAVGGRKGDGIRADVEDIVAADSQLNVVGEVVPHFRIRQTDAGLVEGNEFAAGIGAGVAVLRSPIGFAHRGAEFIQRPVRGQADLFLRRGMHEVVQRLLVEEAGIGIGGQQHRRGTAPPTTPTCCCSCRARVQRTEP